MKLTLKTTSLLASLALGAGLAQAAKPAVPPQGVSATEITLGSIQDLSGPIAGFGKQARLGMLLAVDEINEQGGINGRKVKLIVEDSAYDPKKASLAAQKLVNQDKIFMMVGHIGTAQNLAAMPVQFEKNVVNFFPITAAREMYEPFDRLKYSYAATYFDQMRRAVPSMAFGQGPHVCLGAALTLMEAQAVWGQMLDRWPDLELARPGQSSRMGSPLYRGPLELPVRQALSSTGHESAAYTAAHIN